LLYNKYLALEQQFLFVAQQLPLIVKSTVIWL
jgi:hypothetical protein